MKTKNIPYGAAFAPAFITALVFGWMALTAHGETVTNTVPGPGFVTAPSIIPTTAPGVQQLLSILAKNLPPVLGSFQWTNLVADGNLLESGGKFGGEGNLLYPTGSGPLSPYIGIGAIYEPVSRDWLFQFASVSFKAQANITLAGFNIPVIGYVSTSSALSLRDTSALQAVEEIGAYTYFTPYKNAKVFLGFGKIVATKETSANEFILAFEPFQW